MATKAEQEDAVRAYLESLLQPGFVSKEIEALEQQLADETDVIQIAVLKQAIRDERAGTKLLDGFVANAKAWADGLGIDGRTLQEMGVANEILKRAGFDVQVASFAAPVRASRKRRSAEETEAARREVRKAVNQTRGTFTLRQIAERTGKDYADVKAVIDRALESGQVESLGPDPEHGGRGKAPNLFNKVASLS